MLNGAIHRFLMFFTGMVILANIVSSSLVTVQLQVNADSSENFQEQKLSSYHHSDPIQLEDFEEKIQETSDEHNEQDSDDDQSCILNYRLSGADVHYALSSRQAQVANASVASYPPCFILFENLRL